MKRALISGLTGQDGAYLAKLLLNKGYKVYGTFRRVSTPNFWRPLSLGIYSKIHLIPADLLDMGSLLEALKVSDPDEVYNMGASSYVASSFEEPVVAQEITGISVTKFLESIRQFNTSIKFYQASTSEMYGDNKFKTHLDKYLEEGKFYKSSKKKSRNYFLNFDGLNSRDKLLNEALHSISKN